MKKGDTFTLTSEVRVKDTFDVVVVGGGTAGVVAAIASARTGARTAILEKSGYFGGTLLNGAGPLHSFFNLYKAFPGVPRTQVVRGIPSELVERLISIGGCKGHLEQELGFAYDSVATIIDRNLFKLVAQQMLEESGVRIFFDSVLTDVVDRDGMRGVVYQGKAGPEALLCKIVVDASGDGDAAARAGAGFANKFGDSAVGYPFGMANVDMPKVEAFFKEKGLITQIVHAQKEPGDDNIVRIGIDLKKLEPFGSFMEKSGMWGPLCYSFHRNDLTYINTANKRAVDALDAEKYSAALLELRAQAMEMAKLFSTHIPGFENAYVSWTADTVGVRRTRIIECDHDLSLEQIIDGKRFEDEIAVYGFHDMAPRVMIKNGGVYGIPYRAICPRGLDHLLVAGRLITSTFEAHMSSRNTVSCMAQGQGAGTAAALCAKKGIATRDLPYAELRSALLDQGVFLGSV